MREGKVTSIFTHLSGETGVGLGGQIHSTWLIDQWHLRHGVSVVESLFFCSFLFNSPCISLIFLTLPRSSPPVYIHKHHSVVHRVQFSQGSTLLDLMQHINL